MNEAWQDMGLKRGVHIWRLPVSGHAPRKFVRVFLLSDGEIQAETTTGYIRRCNTIGEAMAYLEETSG